MQLRPYQQDALDEIRKAYAKGKRSILVVSPTGSGKGVMLSSLIHSANEKGARVLFLVHRREILFQVSATLDKIGVSHGVILAGEEHDGGNMVDIATIQTITSRLKRRNYDLADIIVIDEAHGATAATYRKVIEAQRKNLIIGFTATPCRQSGFGLGTMFDHLINVATIHDLTQDGYLVPIRYYAPSEPDLTGVKITAGDYNEKQLEKAMNKPKLVGDVVENWIRLAEDRQSIVFTTTVAHSVCVCEAFNECQIPAGHIDGRTDKEERAETIRQFKAGNLRVICNCAVLTEGVDIPDIACVVMARPTKSLALYLQTIGRGMRPANEKRDLVYIDHAGACIEHGPVDEITEWTLDEKTKMGSKKNEERKKREAKPITCDMCSRLYTGQIKCPDCGNIPDIARMSKDVDYIDAELGEVCFKSKTVKVKASAADKAAWLGCLQWYARQKGYNPGWSSHKYREKFGVWPNKITAGPLVANPETLAWIRGQAARAAIARQKRA